MKKLAVVGLIVGALAATAPPAQAHGWGYCCPPTCCPPVCCYRIECVPVKCVIQVPRCVMVKKEIQVCVPVCTYVDREVCYTRYVPTDCVDCCGCHYCCYQPVVCRTIVRCPVTTCRYEPRCILCPTVVYEPCTVVRHVYRCVPVDCCYGNGGNGGMPGAP